MPTYVYKFLDTNETIEVQQSFTDDPLTEAAHPVTGEVMPVKKVFLPVGVTFKGDGFYKTDSRSSKKSDAPKSDSAKSDAPASDSPTRDAAKPSTATPAASGSTSTSGSATASAD